VNGQLLAECQVDAGIYVAVREDNRTLTRSMVELVVEVMAAPAVERRALVPCLQTYHWALKWAVATEFCGLILVGGDASNPTSLEVVLGPLPRPLVAQFLDAIGRSGNVALTLHGLVLDDSGDFEITVPLFTDDITVMGDIAGATNTVQTLRRRN
jgi:hypothetical protein